LIWAQSDAAEVATLATLWCILGAMGELAVHHALSRRQPGLARPASPNRNTDVAGNGARRILQLQRQAANHAVVNLL
jgi:hypothetical protein